MTTRGQSHFHKITNFTLGPSTLIYTIISSKKRSKMEKLQSNTYQWTKTHIDQTACKGQIPPVHWIIGTQELLTWFKGLVQLKGECWGYSSKTCPIIQHLIICVFPFQDYLTIFRHLLYLDILYIWDTKIVWHLIFFYMKLRCEYLEIFIFLLFYLTTC